MWPVEVISDVGELYLRVHKSKPKPDGANEIVPAIFAPKGNGLSVDWSKYSTVEESRNRAKNPQANGIVTLVAGEVRAIQGVTDVRHDPVQEGEERVAPNRAHAIVEGMSEDAPKTDLVRMRFEMWKQVQPRGWTIVPDSVS